MTRLFESLVKARLTRPLLPSAATTALVTFSVTHRPANVVRFANALVKTNGISASRVDDLEDANALVMIGRSMLGLDEDVVNRLAQGLKERVDGVVGMAS